ncbi:MAG: hypothetical protein AB1422_07960, partial [bacterium]
LAIFIYLICSFLSKRLPPGIIIPIDYPGERKIHKTPTPCSGGMFIFFSIYISLIITFSLYPNIFFKDWPGYTYTSFIFCGMGILILGLWDDHKDIKSFVKLVFQICICSIAVMAGIKFKIVDLEILNIILKFILVSHFYKWDESD